MKNFLDYDCFQSKLYQKNLDKNYIEIVEDYIFQTNTNHRKNILCFYDEVTANHERAYDNIVKYYYYKNNCQNVDVIAKKYIEVWDRIERDFFNIGHQYLTAEKYAIVKGNDWPEYNDYIQNNFSVETNILNEIREFELEHVEISKRNKILQIKNYINDTILNLQKRDQYLETLDKNNTVAFTGSSIIHEYLISKNFKCFLLPIWNSSIIEFIDTKKLEVRPAKDKNQYSYFLLNRKFKREREKTIQELDKNNLLQYGYVTNNVLPFNTENLKVKHKNVKYNNDLSTFDRLYNFPHWKITNLYNKMPCNNIYKNSLEIGNKIESLTQLSVETDLSENFISEKMFQPFLLKRIPLIIAHSDSIKHTKNQGFDFFEDIVDLSFNKIDDIDLKIETAIKDNAELLSTYSIAGLEDRFEHNFDLLLKKFPNNYLNYVHAEINKLF